MSEEDEESFLFTGPLLPGVFLMSDVEDGDNDPGDDPPLDDKLFIDPDEDEFIIRISTKDPGGDDERPFFDPDNEDADEEEEEEEEEDEEDGDDGADDELIILISTKDPDPKSPFKELLLLRELLESSSFEPSLELLEEAVKSGFCWSCSERSEGESINNDECR